MTKRIVRQIKVKNTLSPKVLQNVQIHQKKHLLKKDSKQVDKNENNTNKQLTEIRHNKHKERNRNQSNKEENQDVHKCPKGTVAIIGDSVVSSLIEELLSNKKHQVKGRYCRGAKVEDMFDYVKPILKQKHDYVVLDVGTNNAKDRTSRKILDKLLQLKTAILDSDKNCKVILSQPVKQVDDGKAGFII